jgi:hypothetical protein
VCLYEHACNDRLIDTYAYICMCILISVYLYSNTYAYICMCILVSVDVYSNTYAYIHIYTHIYLFTFEGLLVQAEEEMVVNPKL